MKSSRTGKKGMVYVMKNGKKVERCHWAADRNNLEVLQWIMETGEMTHWAAESGYWDVVKFIVDKNETMIRFMADGAATNGHLNLLNWITAKGGVVSPDALKRVSEKGLTDIVIMKTKS